MNTKQKLLTLALAAGFGGGVSAQTVVQIASSNATIEGTGGANGPSGSPWFHNAQVPGSFESYAISSYTFTAGDFGLSTVSGINGIDVSYMQSNAFFTSDGPVEFFVTFDTTVSGGNYSGLSHSGSGSGIDDS